MLKQIILYLIIGALRPLCAFAQDTAQMASELAQTYGVDSSNGLMGFSIPALIGAMIFGSVGFVAFVYGKKNEELRPLLLGLALMAYPYFVKQTLMLYAVGIVLCGALYFWRE